MLARFTPLDAFELGPIKIYWYSLCLLAALTVSYSLAIRRAKDVRLTKDQISDLFLILFISGIVGARLVYVSQNLAFFTPQPLAILQLTTGGLSIHGGLIGGILALIGYARKFKSRWLTLADWLVKPLLAGQIIGRLGNYFNQELFGYPTDRPWKMLIDPAHRPAGYATSTYFHPTFLYEMLLNSLGLLILSRLKFKKTGQRTATYLLIFATSRFITEIWRLSDRLIGPLSLAQMVSLVIGLSAVIWLAAADDILQKSQNTLPKPR